jgi:hypothetical protein
MRRMHRIVLFAGLVALAPVLAGCENFDMDSLDVFHLNDKKKLPGERKEVFPEGVPGVSQGIPPEYLKGNQQADTALPPDGAAAVAAPGEKSGAAAPSAKTAAIEPAAEPKLKPKPKPKPRTVKQQPKQGTAPPAAQAQSNDQQQLAPWPGSTQPPAAAQAAPWPSAPPPGTFSR